MKLSGLDTGRIGFGTTLAVGLAIGLSSGCGSEANSTSDTTNPTKVIDKCRTAREPQYFVPRQRGRRVVVAGCVELGVSGKTLELSVGNERMAGEEALCLHPAFAGRGNPGMYIPASCLPLPRKNLDVAGSEVPTQGVTGYAYVLWGDTPRAGTVTVSSGGSESDAAVFPVSMGGIAPKGINLYVAELPAEAACTEVSVSDGAGTVVRVPPHAPSCEVATRTGND